MTSAEPRYTAPRGDVRPIRAGLKGRCPACGEGPLFQGVLTIPANCSVCGLDYAFADAGDGPMVFATFFLGIVVLGAALVLEMTISPALWVHLVLWVPLTIGLGLLILRPLKGVLITLQYAYDAHEANLLE